jgi:hypothetical protein
MYQQIGVKDDQYENSRKHTNGNPFSMRRETETDT